MTTTTKTTTERAQLGNWPGSCGDPSCFAHLTRDRAKCRCPRFKAEGQPGYHITKANLDCPVHGTAAAEPLPAVPDGTPTSAVLAQIVMGTPSNGKHRQRRAPRPADLDDICHREILGTDDIFAGCPQCGHLLAVHIGTKGCPVCLVEMMAAAWGRR